MAVGDLVAIDVAGVNVVGVQLTNARNSTIARIHDDGGVSEFRPRGESARTLAAAGTPRAQAAARLITDSTAAYSGSVAAAARANGLASTTQNDVDAWRAARDTALGNTTARPAASATAAGTGNS